MTAVMPHATEDETMADADEVADVGRFLDQYGTGLEVDSHHDREFDQRDKAKDAVDYEDISDEDDLPEEEEASNRVDGDEDVESLFNRLPGARADVPADAAQQQAHRRGEDGNAKEPSHEDLFGESDNIHDLFGEHGSSPEQQRAQPAGHARPQPGGLALPSKSSLALPGASGLSQTSRPRLLKQSSGSMSPPSLHGDGYSPADSLPGDSSDEEASDPALAAQRRLFKTAAKKYAGEEVEETQAEIKFDLFYSLYPRYEQNQNPNFVDLFPPRAVSYRGKLPFKPPKSIQPAKLSLDLLQDQEKSFRAPIAVNKDGDNAPRQGLVLLRRGSAAQDESDDDLGLSAIDDPELVGGVTLQDLALLCEDWDIPSVDCASDFDIHDDPMDGSWDTEERNRPKKKQILDTNFSLSLQDSHVQFDAPERATSKISKSIALDMNDPHLLLDELAPQTTRRTARVGNGMRRDVASSKDLAKRYNISNDEAYDMLKENHQHKVRSTLGNMAIEHSLVATKLQYPFYKTGLDSKAKRAFHRPHLDIRDGRNREFRFQKLKHIKRKQVRGRDPKELFAKAEDLHIGDNAGVLLLEYSEEAPMMLSNFGMGNRLINYYRKKDADDQERPKRDIGETQVLLTQDKSPFANFGHVDKGEIVPTIQNGLYRAPVFEHQGRKTDFLVGVSSTYAFGNRFFIRNVENLHTVGQQFPLSEVPGEHSRKVTDAAKKRLRALSYRMYSKSVDPLRPIRGKPVNNENLMPHLPGHDMPQTRSKMREFMKYDRAGKDSGGVWVPLPGQVVPDADTLRSWIKPEDVCLLDSMQVGAQHLADLGFTGGKEGDEDKDVEEGANIELQLAPWQTTKNFLNACQGKAMLKLHGEGDPTGRGEGFSFVKTSMKGGFQALGESVEDKIEAKKRRDHGGHSYNVAKQQKAYDDNIRMIWEKQKQTLSADVEISDTEVEDDAEPESAYPYGQNGTPRSSRGTPAAFARHDDESASQFSRGSVGRGERALTIVRKTMNKYGQATTTYEKVTNPRVIALYTKRRNEKRVQKLGYEAMNPTGDPELDALKRQELQKEIARIQKNADRRVAREKAKGRVAGSASVVGSPGASDADAPTTSAVDGTPQKGAGGAGRGRNKDGTARKCANCGQVGHIKTNRKLCPMLNGTMKPEDIGRNGDNSFGAVPAPLNL